MEPSSKPVSQDAAGPRTQQDPGPIVLCKFEVSMANFDPINLSDIENDMANNPEWKSVAGWTWNGLNHLQLRARVLQFNPKLDILELIEEHPYKTALRLVAQIKYENDIDVCAVAAGHGFIHCLKYFHENGCPWDETATKYAAGEGNLECLKYLHENGCPWDEKATYYAASNDQLECLKYLHNNRCPWSEKATYYAAKYGHLECLKYLHNNGCPWNETATSFAADNGHLDCLKYLHKNGCPWDENAPLWAADNGHLECLKYLHENGCPWNNVPVHQKAQVWWMMVKDLVRIRPFIFFWQEQTAIRVYSETGIGRKRDREEFEQVFQPKSVS